MLTVKPISSGAGQRGLAPLAAADRHGHLSSSQPPCRPCQKICRWLPASHQPDGSGVATCWFTKVWSTHTNYRRQRALTTSIWWAMRAIVCDMWKQRGRAALPLCAAGAGAALSPRPPRALPPPPGDQPNLRPPRGKSIFSDTGRKKQEGLEAVSRDVLVISFSHCCGAQCKEMLRNGGSQSNGKC